MNFASASKHLRITVLTLAFLLLPQLVLGIFGGVDAWIVVLLTLATAGFAEVGARYTKSELRELTLVPPLASVSVLAVLAFSGPLTVLLGGISAVGVLLWLGTVLTPFGRVRDASLGIALPAMGLAVAAAITFLVPSGHAYVGVAASLIAGGIVLVAVVLALMVPERTLALPS